VSVDIHAHIVSKALVDLLAGEIPEIAPKMEGGGRDWHFSYPSGRRSGPIPPGMFDLGSRLADMDRQGVDVQALSVPPTHFFYDLAPDRAVTAARLHNDDMVLTARSRPDRFVVLATLPLQAPDGAVAEIERLVAEPIVVGVELATNVAGRNLDDPSLSGVWAALAKAGMPAVLHPDNPVGGDRTRRYFLHNLIGLPTDTTLAAACLIFGGVLVDHPALRVGLVHGGGFLPYQIGRLDHGWMVRREPREHLAVAPRSLLDRFYFDTVTHDLASLRFLLERVGPDRLCLGSDYPFDMADHDPAGSVRLAIGSAEIQDMVLEATPRRFLARRP
jgi:aminocarboxymuconate-semialdehyde decarboxylase